MAKETLGQLIKTSRLNKKMSQQELAQKLNVTRQAVSNWENEISYPDQSLYVLLCKELNIDLNDIYGDLINNDFDNLLKLNKKKYQKIIILVSIIFILIFIVLLFINHQNKFHYYKLSNDSSFFKMNSSYYLYSNNKNYLTIGSITSDIFNVENSTINIFYKDKNNTISIYNGKYSNNIKINTKRKDITKNINNLYIEIFYTYNKIEYKEQSKLIFKEIMNNQKIINDQGIETIIEHKNIYSLNPDSLVSNGYKYIANSKIYVKEGKYNYNYSPEEYTFTASGGTNDDIFYAEKNYRNNYIKIGYLSSTKNNKYVIIYLANSLIKYNNDEKFNYEPYLNILNKELTILESN